MHVCLLCFYYKNIRDAYDHPDLYLQHPCNASSYFLLFPNRKKIKENHITTTSSFSAKNFVCNHIPSLSACWMQVCIKSTFFFFWNSKYYLAPAVVLDLSVVLGTARRSLPVAIERSSEIRPLGFIWFIAWLLPSHILSIGPSKTTSGPEAFSAELQHSIHSQLSIPGSFFLDLWLFHLGLAGFISTTIAFHAETERAVGCVPSIPALFWKACWDT